MGTILRIVFFAPGLRFGLVLKIDSVAGIHDG